MFFRPVELCRTAFDLKNSLFILYRKKRICFYIEYKKSYNYGY